MNYKHLFLTALLTTGACSPTPPSTLEEQLSGKTPAEKQEILRLACLNKAEDLGNSDSAIRTVHGVKPSQDTAETHRLKDICRGISQIYPAGADQNGATR